MRSPYILEGGTRNALAKAFAERGFQAVIQSCRGYEQSEGVAGFGVGDREDGLDTIEWLKQQPWFGDSIIMCGPSYQGFVQLALGGVAPKEVKLFVISEANSKIGDILVRKDPYFMEASVGWGIYMDGMSEEPISAWAQKADKQLGEGIKTLPIADIELKILGHRTALTKSILDAEHCVVYDDFANTKVPVIMQGGWFDPFIAGQLSDLNKLKANGTKASITIGEWGHSSPELTALPIQEAIAAGKALARNEELSNRPFVKYFIMGADTWATSDEWPPAGYSTKKFYFSSNRALSETMPDKSGTDEYRYDPADPTPVAGGVRLMPYAGVEVGRQDQSATESRKDVLTYTSNKLETALEVVGDITAQVSFSSSLQYADIFVRLCDVDETGVSRNICDGIIRLNDADKQKSVTVALAPTAFRFEKGHCIRVQVSGGAFPIYSRNMGTGDNSAYATEMKASDNQVFFGADSLSFIELPVKTLG